MVNKKYIKVKSYSGSKAEQVPRQLILGGNEYEIKEITDSWIEEDVNIPGQRLVIFKVIINNNKEVLIGYIIELDKWIIRNNK